MFSLPALAKATSLVLALARLIAGGGGANSPEALSQNPGNGLHVRSAAVVDSNHVDVTFNKVVDPASAGTAAHYAVQPALAVTGAALQAGGKTVRLATAEQRNGTLYTLTVMGVRDGSLKFLVGKEDTATFTGIGVPPRLTGARPINANTVELAFDEAVDAATTGIVSCYTVRPTDGGFPVVVSGAQRQPDPTKVWLTTSEHTGGTHYAVTVTGITDVAGNPIGSTDSSAAYTALGDPPRLVSAIPVADGTGVRVLFSEALDPVTAAAVGSYAFSPSLAISSAQLQGDGAEVLLTTAALAPGTTYTLTAAGVKDAALNLVDDAAKSGTFTTPPAPALGRIAYAHAGKIYIMNADGTGRVHVGSGDFVSWAPDGTRLAVAGGSLGLNVYVMNADGSGLTQLTSAGQRFAPSWSPDGAHIAYTMSLGTEFTQYICVMNADGSGQRQLTSGSLNGAYNGWLGNRILFHSGPPSPRHYQIYSMNIDGSDVRQVASTPGNDTSGWGSPDGSRIAFTADRDGNYEVYVMDVDGTHQVNLTNAPSADAMLGGAWSPDGNRLAFYSNRSGIWGIWTMNADGCEQRRLADGVYPSWGSDPQSPSAYSAAASANPSIISANGTATSTITVTVRDGGYRPLPGTSVNLGTSLGSISPATATTDASGQVTATLTAGTTTGTATVTAFTSGGKNPSASVPVTFAEPPPAVDLHVSYTTTAPTVNGSIGDDPGWRGVYPQRRALCRPDGTTHEMRMYLVQDGTWLYVGVQSGFAAGWDSYMVMYLDGDHDGRAQTALSGVPVDLLVGAASQGGWTGYDYYNRLGSPSGSLTPPAETVREGGGGADVAYEFKLKLSEFQVQPDKVMGIRFQIGTNGTGAGTYAYPGSASVEAPSTWAHTRLEGSVVATASPLSIPPDGQTQSTITATVRDVDGNPVANAPVLFETDLGTLNADSATTGPNGQASATLKAGAAGAARVTASLSSGEFQPGYVDVAVQAVGGAYDCVDQFSTQQGTNGFYYGYYGPSIGYGALQFGPNPSAGNLQEWFTPMPPSRSYGQPRIGLATSSVAPEMLGYLYCQPGDDYQRLDGVVTWQAQSSGAAVISGGIKSGPINGAYGSDGFRIHLFVSGTEVWSQDVPGASQVITIPDYVCQLSVGDYVRLHVDHKSATYYDHSGVRLHIALTSSGRGPALRSFGPSLRAVCNGEEAVARLATSGLATDTPTRAAGLRFEALDGRAGLRSSVSGRSWEFRLHSLPDQETALSWPDLGGLGAKERVTLEDLDANMRRNMRTTASYVFRGESRRFRVTADKRGAAPLAVMDLALEGAGRGNARVVRVTLSADADLDLDVITPTGALMAEVARAQALTAGTSRLAWRANLPPGLYILRARARSADATAVQSIRPVVITR